MTASAPQEGRPLTGPQDPLADFVAIWRGLEVFREQDRLSDEGRRFLVETLQEAVKRRLLRSRSVTLKGARRALDMASRLEGSGGDEVLRRHLLDVAQEALRRRFGPDFPATDKTKNEHREQDMKNRKPSGATDPWHLAVTADDDALLPVIAKGQTVIVDCSERALADGAFYALREGQSLRLWLYQDGFAGTGNRLGGRATGTLSGLAGTFRCRAPVDTAELAVVGRVVEDAAKGLIDLEAERVALLKAAEAAEAALRDGGGRDREGIEAVLRRVRGEGRDAVAQAARRLTERLEDGTFAQRFILAQRLDALDARLLWVEDRIATQDSRSLDDVRIKLQLLWDLHYAPFPATHDDLAARVVADALRAVKAHTAQSPPPQTLQLVATPGSRG